MLTQRICFAFQKSQVPSDDQLACVGYAMVANKRLGRMIKLLQQRRSTVPKTVDWYYHRNG